MVSKRVRLKVSAGYGSLLENLTNAKMLKSKGCTVEYIHGYNNVYKFLTSTTGIFFKVGISQIHQSNIIFNENDNII